MAKKANSERSDLQECAEKIRALLDEYGCELLDPDEGHHVLLWDKDTNKMRNVYS